MCATGPCHWLRFNIMAFRRRVTKVDEPELAAYRNAFGSPPMTMSMSFCRRLAARVALTKELTKRLCSTFSGLFEAPPTPRVSYPVCKAAHRLRVQLGAQE